MEYKIKIIEPENLDKVISKIPVERIVYSQHFIIRGISMEMKSRNEAPIDINNKIIYLRSDLLEEVLNRNPTMCELYSQYSRIQGELFEKLVERKS